MKSRQDEWTPPAPTGPTHALDQKTQITIVTYNVVSARGTCLLEALHTMQELNTDIAILTEAKLTNNKHARHGHGFNVFATLAPSASQGGVVLVWRAEPRHWILEGLRAISPNSISATIVSGDRRWLLLGTYLSPNEPPDLELNALEIEFQRHSQIPVMLLGDLNADFDDHNSDRSVAIATTLQHLGVMDQFS